MRIASVIAILALGAAVGGSCAAAPKADACEVGLEVVKVVAVGHGHDFVFSGEGPISAVEGAGPWKPSAGLAAALSRSRGGPRLDGCPQVQRWLREKKIRFGPEAAKAAKDSGFRLELFSATLPVVSADGREAIYRYDRRMSGTGSNGGYRHMQRQADGSWRTLSVGMSYIS